MREGLLMGQEVFPCVVFTPWIGAFPALWSVCVPLVCSEQLLGSHGGDCCLLAHMVLEKVLKKNLLSHFWFHLLGNLQRKLFHSWYSILSFNLFFPLHLLFFSGTEVINLHKQTYECLVFNAKIILYCKETLLFRKPPVCSSSMQGLSLILCLIW